MAEGRASPPPPYEPAEQRGHVASPLPTEQPHPIQPELELSPPPNYPPPDYAALPGIPQQRQLQKLPDPQPPSYMLYPRNHVAPQFDHLPTVSREQTAQYNDTQILVATRSAGPVNSGYGCSRGVTRLVAVLVFIVVKLIIIFVLVRMLS